MNNKQLNRRLNFIDIVSIIWFLIDGITHLTIELGFIYLALTITPSKSDTFMGFIWREYSKADKRWEIRDPNIISLELITVLLFGPLTIYQAYCIYKRKAHRHLLQIVICVAELYGGWMTFVPEIIENNPNLNCSNFLYFWIYLVFMNGVWVIIPIILLWESWFKILDVCNKSKIENNDYRDNIKGLPSILWFWFIFIILIIYSILVPFIIFSAEAPIVD